MKRRENHIISAEPEDIFIFYDKKRGANIELKKDKTRHKGDTKDNLRRPSGEPNCNDLLNI